jgi:alpha-beta hydrolase superfamily lysophospholipase
MKNILPSLVQPSGLVVEHISHDRKVVENYKNDPLIHNKISVSLFSTTMSAASSVLKNAGRLNKHLLLVHGLDDHICSPEGSREFASKAVMAELKLWDGGYHELHNDVFRDEVSGYIISWINSRIA